jgi:hypothetical protein
LTTRQLARHKRLGIYHSDSWSNFPEDKIKIAVNTSRGASTAIAGFIAGIRETSNPNFCLLHKHHHSPLYHSEHRSRTKPSPRSIYFDKNTPLPADIDYPNQFKTENLILSLPTWFSQLPLKERKRRLRIMFPDSVPPSYFSYSDDIYLPDPPVAISYLPDFPISSDLPTYPHSTDPQQSQPEATLLDDPFAYLDSLNSTYVDSLPSPQSDLNNMDTDFEYFDQLNSIPADSLSQPQPDPNILDTHFAFADDLNSTPSTSLLQSETRSLSNEVSNPFRLGSLGSNTFELLATMRSDNHL